MTADVIIYIAELVIYIQYYIDSLIEGLYSI